MRVLDMKKQRGFISDRDLLGAILVFGAVCSIAGAGLVLAAGALWGWLRPFIHAWTG
jgi:hypothetical protein